MGRILLLGVSPVARAGQFNATLPDDTALLYLLRTLLCLIYFFP